MATREELLGGLQFVPAQAKRVAGILDEEGAWDTKRPAGWTPKEMLTHVAVVAGMVPATAPAMMLSAPETRDITAGMDIAALNEQGVASMRAMEPKQVVDALVANYGKLSDWVKSLSDETMTQKHTFAGMTLSTSDLLMTLTVMHSIHHLYEAPLPVAF